MHIVFQGKFHKLSLHKSCIPTVTLYTLYFITAPLIIVNHEQFYTATYTEKCTLMLHILFQMNVIFNYYSFFNVLVINAVTTLLVKYDSIRALYSTNIEWTML